MQSKKLLQKVFPFVAGMLLVFSMFCIAQHAQASGESIELPQGLLGWWPGDGSAGKIKSPSTIDALVNGGFESGDLTGWTVGFGNGSATVVTTNPYSGVCCACITGLQAIYQGFQGIPTSSIESITYCTRTEPKSSTR